MQNTQFDYKLFKTSAESFLAQLCVELQAVGVNVTSLECDHLCYRVKTESEYEFYKNQFLSFGKLLTEAQVNGRAISTFEMLTPFKTQTHEVFLLELPSPKAGSPYETGFEHAEFVIQESFEEFQTRHAHLSFNIGGNKNLNPELCLKLTNRLQAKFHHLSLKRVIELEESQVTDVIFDLDGTLVRSLENIYEVNRLVFSQILKREVTLQESINNYYPEFAKLFQAYAVDCPEQQKAAVNLWGEISQNFRYELFEGAIKVFTDLKNQGFTLHLWTARDEPSARAILQDHQIEDYFATLSFATEEKSKPQADSLGFDYFDKSRLAIMVGDSSTDMFGAHNIKAIKAAALWDSETKKATLIKSGAELFFYNIQELAQWIIRSKS